MELDKAIRKVTDASD